MATFIASLPPSIVPRAIAPIRFSSACNSSFGMTTLPSVAGTSVSGTSIFATRIVPGEVMITAESRCRASTPCEIYMAMMPPETCAMPLVIITISSLRVAFDKKRPNRQRRFGLPHKDAGRYVHALRAGNPHRLQHHPRHAANNDLHHPDVIEHREECRDEDDRRQHLESKDRAGCGRNQLAERSGVGQTELTKQHLVPANVAESMLFTTPPAHVIARCP